MKKYETEFRPAGNGDDARLITESNEIDGRGFVYVSRFGAKHVWLNNNTDNGTVVLTANEALILAEMLITQAREALA